MLADVAALALDKCITVKQVEANGNTRVEFNYEFLDDTLSNWKAQEGKDNLKFQGTKVEKLGVRIFDIDAKYP